MISALLTANRTDRDGGPGAARVSDLERESPAMRGSSWRSCVSGRAMSRSLRSVRVTVTPAGDSGFPLPQVNRKSGSCVPRM